MNVLLDTNIIIHREAKKILNEDIGILFKWLDQLGYRKCIHPITLEELKKYQDKDVANSISIKAQNYHVLEYPAPLSQKITLLGEEMDKDENDRNDTKLLNELEVGRVAFLLTEDKRIHAKASRLGISDKVFRINSFLEKANAENPSLTDYKVLSVKLAHMGLIDHTANFFNNFRIDYPGFDSWYHKKVGENQKAYVTYEHDEIKAFLLLKIETEKEVYSDISPTLPPKKRLKIATFKVTSNGHRLGERFLKIIFDNARKQKVDEIYVTVFDDRPELQNLIYLLEKFGFTQHGKKGNGPRRELVLVRDFAKSFNTSEPEKTYPWLSKNGPVFMVPIKPAYHFQLFPESILNNENPQTLQESVDYQNAICKSYICKTPNRYLQSGDTLVFYRSGGFYKGVVTTIGIVQSTVEPKTLEELRIVSNKRTVLKDQELSEIWNKGGLRPIVIQFLYCFSFKKRMNLKEMLDRGIISNMESLKTVNPLDRTAYENLVSLCGV